MGPRDGQSKQPGQFTTRLFREVLKIAFFKTVPAKISSIIRRQRSRQDARKSSGLFRPWDDCHPG